jgi:hypothetical protein
VGNGHVHGTTCQRFDNRKAYQVRRAGQEAGTSLAHPPTEEDAEQQANRDGDRAANHLLGAPLGVVVELGPGEPPDHRVLVEVHEYMTVRALAVVLLGKRHLRHGTLLRVPTHQAGKFIAGHGRTLFSGESARYDSPSRVYLHSG